MTIGPFWGPAEAQRDPGPGLTRVMNDSPGHNVSFRSGRVDPLTQLEAQREGGQDRDFECDVLPPSEAQRVV